MNAIHDMGGMHGFGPIVPEANEPVFHHAWQGRVYAMAMYTPVPVPGGFRYMIEKMPAQHYLASSYYEKWLHARIQGLLESGSISATEWTQRLARFSDNPDATVPVTQNPEATHNALQRPAPEAAKSSTPPYPLYDIGMKVRARNMHPAAHTRLPRYVRGRRCTIDAHLGDWSLDDTPAPGQPHAIEPLYRVRFEAVELWGDDAETNTALYIDMWQSYLEPLPDATTGPE